MHSPIFHVFSRYTANHQLNRGIKNKSAPFSLRLEAFTQAIETFSLKLGILAWARASTVAHWALYEFLHKRDLLAWARLLFPQNWSPSLDLRLKLKSLAWATTRAESTTGFHEFLLERDLLAWTGLLFAQTEARRLSENSSRN